MQGRAPSEPLNGSESSSGTVNTEFPTDEFDSWFAYVMCNSWAEKHKATLKITHDATDSDDITISLPDATDVTVSVAENDTIAEVVEKIVSSENSYSPYVAKVSPFASDTVEFEIVGEHTFVDTTEPEFDGGDSGVTGVMAGIFNAKELTPSDIQKTFYVLREYTQNPAKYQLFKGMKVNQLTMSCEVDAFVKLAWELQGVDNPTKVDVSPVSLTNPKPNFTTKSMTTMNGALKVNGVANRQSSTFELTLNNNMEATPALFEKEAIESSLGNLEITGSVTEYFTTGELYNRAINGEKTPIEISFNGMSGTDKVKYVFEVMTKFDPPTEDGDTKLSHTLGFKTFGQNRMRITKVVGENAY